MADSICASVGARLCTAAELASDVARGTGCGFDNANVWTSDVCADGHIAADGDSRPQDALHVANACVADGEHKAVRCCASGAELCAQLNAEYSGWPISDSVPIVCGESDVMPSCFLPMNPKKSNLQQCIEERPCSNTRLGHQHCQWTRWVGMDEPVYVAWYGLM